METGDERFSKISKDASIVYGNYCQYNIPVDEKVYKNRSSSCTANSVEFALRMLSKEKPQITTQLINDILIEGIKAHKMLMQKVNTEHTAVMDYINKEDRYMGVLKFDDNNNFWMRLGSGTEKLFMDYIIKGRAVADKNGKCVVVISHTQMSSALYFDRENVKFFEPHGHTLGYFKGGAKAYVLEFRHNIDNETLCRILYENVFQFHKYEYDYYTIGGGGIIYSSYEHNKDMIFPAKNLEKKIEDPNIGGMYVTIEIIHDILIKNISAKIDIDQYINRGISMYDKCKDKHERNSTISGNISRQTRFDEIKVIYFNELEIKEKIIAPDINEMIETIGERTVICVIIFNKRYYPIFHKKNNSIYYNIYGELNEDFKRPYRREDKESNSLSNCIDYLNETLYRDKLFEEENSKSYKVYIFAKKYTDEEGKEEKEEKKEEHKPAEPVKKAYNMDYDKKLINWNILDYFHITEKGEKKTIVNALNIDLNLVFN